MDERHAHFLILLGEVCASAELADLRVEVQTTQGSRIAGVPEALLGVDDPGDVDGIPRGESIRIDGIEVDIPRVVSFSVAAPGGSAGRS